RNKPQYHKYAGMLSFPIETFDGNKDSNLTDTLVRLSREELGISNADEMRILGIIPTVFNPIPERRDIHIRYSLGAFLGDPHRIFVPEDKDVEIVGWMKPEKLHASHPIRIEVKPILEDFFSRKK
ncbi:MAG: NUDIX hydrolase, partial [Candidatus Moranbacteria bacterium]|nr:NUDIX hydrolase [Candidatus Moranbacteria bacterium]